MRYDLTVLSSFVGAVLLFGAGAARADQPGLDPALSASPPYVCVTNYYVSTTGNDANPGTKARPWKTIQNADNGYPNTPKAGECVNVEPGTYAIPNTLIVSHGGNANSAKGYVVYRSVEPQKAHLVAPLDFGDMIEVWASYIVIDGFEIDGNSARTSGAGIDGCAGGGTPTLIAHHLTAINNIVHDLGGAGITTCTAEYIVWEHNVVYRTATASHYQLSALDLWQPAALAKGSFKATAADDATFHIVIAYNIAYDNIEGPSVPTPHTDGNGIIIDTTLDSSTCPACGTPYPGQILVLGNLAYNNGGSGIHLFLSKNVTVVNNTVYNNDLDAANPGTERGELFNGGSQAITWINNIAYAVKGGGILADNKPIATFPVQGGFEDSGTWTKNITYGAAPQSDRNSFVNPKTNLIGINPMLTNPANGDFVPLSGSRAVASGQAESYIPVAKPNIGAYYSDP
jgi:parallel beta-helix repeat protein